jgi:hypothetical protein
MFINQILKVFARPNSKPARRRSVLLQVEQLAQRIVPSTDTIWNPADPNIDVDWSNADNWSNGLPDSNKVAVFDGGQRGAFNCLYDNSVLLPNRTVAGIRTQNNYGNALLLRAGFGLTVSSTIADTGNGFKWGSGNSTGNIYLSEHGQ